MTAYKTVPEAIQIDVGKGSASDAMASFAKIMNEQCRMGRDCQATVVTTVASKAGCMSQPGNTHYDRLVFAKTMP